MFEALGLPVGLIVNSAIVDHCPELVAAYRSRLATELIAHGCSNSESQNEFDEAAEVEMIAESRDRLAAAFGERPAPGAGVYRGAPRRDMADHAGRDRGPF